MTCSSRWLRALVATLGIVTGMGSGVDTQPARSVDGLFGEQAGEMDRKKRETTLHKIEQLVHDKALVAPIWELGFLNGVGPRVGKSGLGFIPGHAYAAPYEDLALRAR